MPQGALKGAPGRLGSLSTEEEPDELARQH